MPWLPVLARWLLVLQKLLLQMPAMLPLWLLQKETQLYLQQWSRAGSRKGIRKQMQQLQKSLGKQEWMKVLVQAQALQLLLMEVVKA